MASSRWVADAESAIFTQIEYYVTNQFVQDYPEIYFTRDEDFGELDKNVHPTIFIHFSENEVGNDLDNTGINATECTMDILVTVSKSQGIDVAKDVIYEVLDNAKNLRFNVLMMPEVTRVTSDVTEMAMRVRRTIGYNDVLNI